MSREGWGHSGPLVPGVSWAQHLIFCPAALGPWRAHFSDFKPSRIRLAVDHPNCSALPDLEISTAPTQSADATSRRSCWSFYEYLRRSLGVSRSPGCAAAVPSRSHGSVSTCCEPRASACRRTCAGLCCARSAPGCTTVACRFCTRFASGTRACLCPQSLLLSWGSLACCSQLFCGARAGQRKQCALWVVTDHAWLLRAQLLDTSITVYSCSKEHMRLHCTLTAPLRSSTYLIEQTQEMC